MKTFNYRVLAQIELEEVYLTIHTVYYDEENIPISYGENPSYLGSENIEDLKSELDRMSEAIKKPILCSGDRFPEEYKEVISEIETISSDEEYIRLRVERNKERDKLNINHIRGSVKTLDIPLEEYERKMGTEYCEKIYLESKNYKS